MDSFALAANKQRTADVFVQVHPEDYGSVLKCVESIRRHVWDQCGRICVVTAALPIALRQKLQADGVELLQEKDVFGFDGSALPAEFPNRSRLFAHLLKWELRKFSCTPTYLAMDAACMLNRPIKLWRDNLPVILCENRYHYSYSVCSDALFGQSTAPNAPAIGEIQHFDKSMVDAMVTRIRGRFMNAPWQNITLAILQQIPGTAFDAGKSYGHYLNLFQIGSFAVEPYQSLHIQAAPTPPGVVRMTTLGHNGRFGNQVFQYAYLMLYAQHEGLRADCPEWIGCSLFGHQTQLCDCELPIYREDRGEVDEMVRFDPKQRRKNFELWGYFEEPRYFAENKEDFRRLFQPLPFLKTPLDEAINRLRGGGGTLVAIHIRRGDYTGGPTFWPAPEEWYLQWLEQLWPTLSNPVLYIATDDPQKVLPKFTSYCPKSAADLNVTVNGAEYYTDFYVLSQSDVLGTSNSTFSFAAAMLNTKASMICRPDPIPQAMVACDPWRSQVRPLKPEAAPMTIAA